MARTANVLALIVAAWLALPAGGEVVFERNLVYGRAGGVPLYLDLARPATGENLPAVLCLHGGGWKAGDKAGYGGVLQFLAENGYVAASANYRLTPAARFPAQVEDAKCAVRYLRSRAGDLHLDPTRIAAMGESAGGHLALMLGLTEARDGLEGEGGHGEFGSRVAAVVNYYGPTDFASWQVAATTERFLQPSMPRGLAGLLDDFLGTHDPSAAIIAKVSPITYITPDDPPVLTFHGDRDSLVPIQQARVLHGALEAKGVQNTLVVVPGGGHGWGGPARDKTNRQTLAFLDRELKGQFRSALPADPFKRIVRDVVYATAEGAPLHLDLAVPDGTGPFPAIICFHGGNYRSNARRDLYDELLIFARNGFAAASVEYRGPGRGKFPEPLEDARAALAFLRANAARFRIDPARIGAFGVSFGSWEALMLALSGAGVRAVVDRYGPTDLSLYASNPLWKPLFKQTLGNDDPESPEVVKVSPLHYVSPDDPPVLIVHNPADQAVPIAQSEALRDALQKAGVHVELIRIAGGFHASEFRPGTDVDRREHDRCQAAELAFFKRWLAP